ncbi:MAG: hypothetical protein U9Q90_04810 [Campylobacterota bacterium]|nr:hypothetical protein [Campylobacterota bacterium]
MKIIGHPWIECERFVVVNSLEEIKKSPAGSVLLFGDLANSIVLLRYCRNEDLPFAVETGDVKSALFAHALGARYILLENRLAKEIQALAQHYLFDTEILVMIRDDHEIERYAKMGIDGVIFASSIQRL